MMHSLQSSQVLLLASPDEVSSNRQPRGMDGKNRGGNPSSCFIKTFLPCCRSYLRLTTCNIIITLPLPQIKDGSVIALFLVKPYIHLYLKITSSPPIMTKTHPKKPLHPSGTKNGNPSHSTARPETQPKPPPLNLNSSPTMHHLPPHTHTHTHQHPLPRTSPVPPLSPPKSLAQIPLYQKPTPSIIN